MNKIQIAILLIAVSFFAACSKKDKTKPEKPNGLQKEKIAEKTTKKGLKVTFWSDNKTLNTGYNKVYFSLEKANQPITDAQIKLMPMMDMGNMSHGCPVEQPTYDKNSHLYEGALVFTMASGGMMPWNITFAIDGDSATAFSPQVDQAPTKVVGTYTGSNAKNYVLTLLPHKSWEVGMNDFGIAIYQSSGMMRYTPANDFTIEFTPAMPSMGHSSPNNVAPDLAGKGHYLGKVNFTMTGDWRLYFKVMEDNDVILDTAKANIEITF